MKHVLLVNGEVVGTYPSKEDAERAKRQLPLQEQTQARVAQLLVG